jgi:hypothetical protein
MERMPDRRIALIMLLLLLALGCTVQKKETAVPNASCECVNPHTEGKLIEGTCYCQCEGGYRRYNGTCISQGEYDHLRPAICESECAAAYPHSTGMMKDGNCTCPCEKGYASYNRTCITPKDFEGLAPALCPAEYPVLKIYDWRYAGKNHYVYICYEKRDGGMNVENRTSRKDLWNFVHDPYSNNTVELATRLLTEISDKEGLGEDGRVGLTIAFVQGLPYTYDNVSTPFDEYPRFPSETIYDDGGDCEDTAILMAAILKRMGYDVVLLSLPGHVAAGISCDPSGSNRTAYPYEGREYCYLETTGEGYGIGELPAEFSSTNVTVIPLGSPRPDLYLGYGQENVFRYAYSYDRYDTYVNVTGIRIDNFGALTAKNVEVDVSLEAMDGTAFSSRTIEVGDMPARGYTSGAYATNLHAPTGESFRISVVVRGDEFESVESKSGWVAWK